MADALSKVTIFYQFQGGSAPAGWTENFYLAAAANPALLLTIQNAYIPKRVEILGAGATMVSIRLSTVPANRITQVYILKPGEGQSKTYVAGTKSSDTDPTQVDLLCRVQDIFGKRRQLWIAGIPDIATDTAVAGGIEGTYSLSGAFTQLTGTMVKLGFGIRWRANPGVLPATYTFGQFLSVQPVSVRNRKRGRPFNLYRGRRLA